MGKHIRQSSPRALVVSDALLQGRPEDSLMRFRLHFSQSEVWLFEWLRSTTVRATLFSYEQSELENKKCSCGA